jgi:membrane-associated protease RseP (regulator of RpoE activity)
MERGYSPIGYASFTSGRAQSEEAALQQAKDVGADLVLIFDPKYAGSTITNVPLVLPTATTALTRATATAVGAGGAVTAHGTSTTTTYGTSTSIIPIAVNLSSYGAIYFIKQHFRLGLAVRDLNNDERRALQTNKGVVVEVVVDGTPAFDADLLVGDIITAVDGQAIGTSASFNALFEERKGKTVSIRFIRDSQTLEKSVTIGV